MYKVTSEFGSTESFRVRSHTGIDFSMEEGTPLRSIRNGVVEQITNYTGNIGKGVLVKWEDGKVAIYGHMSQINVSEGERVKVGDLLGYSGNTGDSTGAHLHFGLKENGHFIDPSPYITHIQNMNNEQQSISIKMSYFEYFQEHIKLITDILSEVKVNLIHFLSNDIPFVQSVKYVVELFFINV